MTDPLSGYECNKKHDNGKTYWFATYEEWHQHMKGNMKDPNWFDTDEEPDHTWADQKIERMWEDSE